MPISEQTLSKMWFKISETLSSPLGYRSLEQNSILKCVVDQSKNDIQLSQSFDLGSDLLAAIIDALENGSIKWPKESKIYKDEWMKMIKMWNVFHYFHTENLMEIQNYERILLQLSSEYLQRRIHLVPYLETESDIFFKPEYSTADGECSYHLMYCNMLWFHNFFISINPIENCFKCSEKYGTPKE